MGLFLSIKICIGIDISPNTCGSIVPRCMLSSLWAVLQVYAYRIIYLAICWNLTRGLWFSGDFCWSFIWRYVWSWIYSAYFSATTKLIILLEEQQFNSKVLGLDILHYVDADSSLNAGFIFFISLWLKFCTSIIICLCIVVGLQSEKVLLTNPSYYAINYSMFITLVSSNTFLIFLSKLFGLYGHFISCLIRPSKYSWISKFITIVSSSWYRYPRYFLFSAMHDHAPRLCYHLAITNLLWLCL